MDLFDSKRMYDAFIDECKAPHSGLVLKIKGAKLPLSQPEAESHPDSQKSE